VVSRRRSPTRSPAARADVAVVYVDVARAVQAATRAAEHGHRAFPVTADIRSASDIDAPVGKARDALGGLDVLETAVGGLMAFGMPFDRHDTVADDERDFVFDVNLRYDHRALKATLKVVIEQGRLASDPLQ
jgi:3-oxoacyl-[acyl-carrier protein] reductase